MTFCGSWEIRKRGIRDVSLEKKKSYRNIYVGCRERYSRPDIFFAFSFEWSILCNWKFGTALASYLPKEFGSFLN